LRILFDKNVPVGVRAFLQTHEVRTTVEIGWPDQLENGELLKKAEESGFDVMVTSDQNIRYQQNLTGRKRTKDLQKTNQVSQFRKTLKRWPLMMYVSHAPCKPCDASTA